MTKLTRITAAALSFALLCGSLNGCSFSVEKLSNPVAVDEDGDVNMEIALAYETDIDALLEKLAEKPVDPTKPVSENTNKKTLEVFNFLRENYGTNMITAQQMYSSAQYEDTVYYTVTGDLPAIKGFDMLHVTGGDASQVDDAIQWHTYSGGLVTFTWHWFVPRDINNPNGGTAFYTDEITNFSLANAVTPGTAEYEVIIHDIDLIAIQLQRLEEAGVPVIWRPLHEAGGGWFWWGEGGRGSEKAEQYKQLWYIVFDRLENYHKLTNLIWVWNAQNATMTVDPNTYDISGIDVYPNSENHSAQLTYYNRLSDMTYEGKMITLSECGYLPDIEDMKDTGAMWLYSMPWYGDFVFAGKGNSPTLDIDSMPSLNPEKMSEEFLKGLFASENVITWNKLPRWEGTEHNLPEETEWRITFANMGK